MHVIDGRIDGKRFDIKAAMIGAGDRQLLEKYRRLTQSVNFCRGAFPEMR